MKKLFILLFMAVSINSFSNDLEFNGNIPLDNSRNYSDFFESAKLWFTNPTPGVAKSLTYINSESGKLKGNFNITFKPDCNSPKCIRAIGKVNFEVSLDLYSTYCEYWFSDFTHAGSERAPGGPISFGRVTTSEICPYDLDGGQKWNDQQWSALKKYIKVKVGDLISGLKILLSGK